MTINYKCGLWRNGVTKTDLSSLIKKGVDGKGEQGLLKVGKVTTLSLSQMLIKLESGKGYPGIVYLIVKGDPRACNRL